jgi:hypothetical protein
MKTLSKHWIKISRVFLVLELSLLGVPSLGNAQVYFPIIETNDITRHDQYSMPIRWPQANSLQYDNYARAGRSAFALGASSFPVWLVSATNDRSIVYLCVTGSVVTATNGHSRVIITPAQANLPAGQYWSELRLYHVDGSSNVYDVTLSDKLAEVFPSAAGAEYEVVNPTNVPFQFAVTINNEGGSSSCVETDPVWSAVSAAITTNAGKGAAAYDWGNHATAGYATGTPVYGESDPIWNAQKSSYATGTPLYGYTETDPVWTSASNQYSRTNHAHSQYATGTPVYVEADPAFNTWLETNAYVKSELDPTISDGITLPAMDGRFLTNFPSSQGGIDPAIASNSFVEINGTQTVSGILTVVGVAPPLMVNNIMGGTGSVMHISSTNLGVAIGREAKAGGGAGGVDTDTGVAIGYQANGYNTGTAIGYQANGNGGGCAGGYQANGTAAFGRSANAVGSGAALGYFANGANKGVAIGTSANGSQTNIAIGYQATCLAGAYRTVIGTQTTNAVDNTTILRGSLYLDGGNGIYFRTNFANGTFDCAIIISNGEVLVRDSSGNVNAISAHGGKQFPVALTNFWPDLTPDELTPGSWNEYTGCGWAKRAEKIEQALSEGLPYPTNCYIKFCFPPSLDWDEDQAAKGGNTPRPQWVTDKLTNNPHRKGPK